MINYRRKNIFDNFYKWVEKNSDKVPPEVSDVTAEIWNLETECDFWHSYASKVTKESRIIKNE